MRKILFVGNPDNHLLYNLAKELKYIDNSLSIDILSYSPNQYSQLQSVYSNIYTPSRASSILKIRGVKFLYILWQFRKQLSRTNTNYDIIHIFYLSAPLGLLTRRIVKMAPQIFISIFGSEFYRSGSIIKFFQSKLIYKSKLITAANQETLDDVVHYFGLGNFHTKVIPFGIRALETIENMKPELSTEIQKKFKIDSSKINIICGYNGSSIQQHDKILNAIENATFSKEINFRLIFQISGSDSPAYKNYLLKRLDDIHFDVSVIDRFLSEEEVAALRMSGDVMIQVQKSDQLSATMLEYMYAGAVVVSGNWLPYNMLKKSNFYFHTIDQIDDLAYLLPEILKSLTDEKSKCLINKEKVWELTNWKTKASQWYAFYF